MGKKRKALSQAEIWDDSALIQSWDDALEEYKLYHSIHARGERVEDVLLSLEAEEDRDNDAMSMVEKFTDAENGMNDENLEDGELEDEVEASMSNHPHTGENPQALSPAKEDVYLQPSETYGAEIPRAAMPQEVIGRSSHDEALKNLMMSWYWAGYYTGHYEGQMEARNSTDQDKSGQKTSG